MKIKYLLIPMLLFPMLSMSQGVSVQLPKEQVISITAEWKGERFDDGRPKVADALLKRLAGISMEEAWGVLRNDGYTNQFDGGWQTVNDKVFTGRALTVQYMPTRPDVLKMIQEKGKAEGRVGATNSWPIDMLKLNDVYVADGFGKIIDGTLIGDNLGNSIYAKSKTGVIFDGGARDVEGLEEIEGFNAYVRGFDPSFIKDMMVTCINCPTRIGRAIVLPGDLVLAKREGVVFIPAHLAEKVIITSEFIALRDTFGHLRLREGKYTPGEIDRQWSDTIKTDFLQWVKDNPKLVPMSKEELDKFLKDRTW